MTTVETATTRNDPRIRFVTGIVLRTQDNLVIEGHTSDVSLSGAFLQTSGSHYDITPGEKGVAAVTVQEQEHEYTMVFPCTVARVTRDGIGLNFDDDE
ncbi:MAG: PilZ domain-containing protein [Magnetococcales bacterium]|nr:PilZ domain-containing protein [Magnetococcales bacterium]